jgi:hypothetical protein
MSHLGSEMPHKVKVLKCLAICFLQIFGILSLSLGVYFQACQNNSYVLLYRRQLNLQELELISIRLRQMGDEFESNHAGELHDIAIAGAVGRPPFLLGLLWRILAPMFNYFPRL